MYPYRAQSISCYSVTDICLSMAFSYNTIKRFNCFANDVWNCQLWSYANGFQNTISYSARRMTQISFLTKFGKINTVPWLHWRNNFLMEFYCSMNIFSGYVVMLINKRVSQQFPVKYLCYFRLKFLMFANRLLVSRTNLMNGWQTALKWRH